MPNYRRFHLPGHPVFLTIVTRGRRPWLGEPEMRRLLQGAMRLAKRRHPFHPLAHVILPDHIHWILRPAEDVSFANVVATMKRDLTWRAKGRGVPTPLWRDRFYDHVIRDDDDLARHFDYVHYNPVKHGLAPSPAAYEYSSFAEWVERGVCTELWGTRQPDRIMGMELE